MKLKQITEKLSDESSFKSLSPDDFLLSPGAVTFIYSSQGELITGDAYTTHRNLIEDNPYLKSDKSMSDGEYRIRRLEYEHLAGRISHDRDVVAFWNKSNQLHGLLPSCVKELLDAGFIRDDTSIVLGDGVSLTPTLADAGTTKRDIDPEKEKELELRKRLHLMSPAEKKEALKQLGLGKVDKFDWRRAHREAGLTSPGQKWWAPTSESVGQ